MNHSETRSAIIDARGLSCPLPLLEARRALMVLEPGDLVTVLATDPMATSDFETFCEESGNELVECSEADGVTKLVVRKAGA